MFARSVMITKSVSAGGAEQVADGRLQGRHGDAVAQHLLDRDGLRAVVERRRGAVGVHVHDVLRPVAGVAQRRGHRLDRSAAVLNAGLAGAPAVIEGSRADPERGDGADPGDDDLAIHPDLVTTRSIASPTVLILPTSSPLSWTPYSSSMICESSARSRESTSRSSNVASRVICDSSTPNCGSASKTVFSTASGVTVVAMWLVSPFRRTCRRRRTTSCR